MAAAIEVGVVCIKTKGREAGRKAVIVDIEKGFAIIDGLNVKRKKCNIFHLFPTGKRVSLKKGAKHEEVLNALKGGK
ncbi:MAG: 50S ribosomal protein L14e [Candidatus Diapherotrites archaeon]|uniref:50S ribosomal protein L14e n=1 Tax=Candidatus Iainarchaeum sp. TaxID=3101447 RepID=A0A7J4IS57_9ARCH|nr:MAG: large subunit ribosomal protein L14e [archaeon GW2011_AR10]MBS3059718.1 50S ribosomal protein L14e [Candidatus Diapherotrites archaeon]HIH08351.1 50S ribosomal protein L14e [Candidatus Diapherotrites archaeon]